jgi:hypothetical protein
MSSSYLKQTKWKEITLKNQQAARERIEREQQAISHLGFTPTLVSHPKSHEQANTVRIANCVHSSFSLAEIV